MDNWSNDDLFGSSSVLGGSDQGKVDGSGSENGTAGNENKTDGLFDGSLENNETTSFGSRIFGRNSNDGSSFGNGSIFGSSTDGDAGSSNLFGSGTGSSSIFGSSLFGSSAESGSSFGNGTESSAESGSSFGNGTESSAESGSSFESSAETPKHPFGDNPFGTNPLGPNPFGNNAIMADNSFGGAMSGAGSAMGLGILKESGNDEEKVCPHCGTDMAENETYCMICGMTVKSVLKKDYQKAMNDSNNQGGGSYGGGSYGGGSYGGGSYGGGSYGGGSYGGGSARVVSSKQSSPLTLILVGIVGVGALIAAIYFIIMGIKTGTAEQTAVLSKTESSNGQVIEEVVTLYAKGDKLTKVTEVATWDASGQEQETIDYVKNYLWKQYEEYTKASFINLDIQQEGKKIVILIEYNYLDVVDNMNYMINHKMLAFDTGKESASYKDYISFKRTKDDLIRTLGYVEKKAAE